MALRFCFRHATQTGLDAFRVPVELFGARLGLRLLAERTHGDGDASSWAPYVNLLPTQFKGVPLFFDGDSLRALQYPPVSAQVHPHAFFNTYQTAFRGAYSTKISPFLLKFAIKFDASTSAVINSV